MPILTWRPWKPTGLESAVAVDRRAHDGAVDQAHVDVREARLPGDRALGLLERLALDAVDELDELGVVDRGLGLLALLGEGRGEALDELAGDADDDLRRPEPGHLLGLLEGDRAVVHDGRDVRDRARLHVRQALAPAAHPAHGPVAGLVDLEDEGLGELRADVQRGAGGRDRALRRGSRCGAGTTSRALLPSRPATGLTRRRRGRRPRPARPRSRPRAPPDGCPCPGPSPGGRRRGRRCSSRPPGRAGRPRCHARRGRR